MFPLYMFIIVYVCIYTLTYVHIQIYLGPLESK